MGILRYLLRAIQCSQWGSLLPRSWNLLVSFIKVLTTACLLLHASQAKSGSCTLPSPIPLSVCPAVTTAPCPGSSQGEAKAGKPQACGHQTAAVPAIPALTKAGPDMSWDTVRSAPSLWPPIVKPKIGFQSGRDDGEFSTSSCDVCFWSIQPKQDLKSCAKQKKPLVWLVVLIWREFLA